MRQIAVFLSIKTCGLNVKPEIAGNLPLAQSWQRTHFLSKYPRFRELLLAACLGKEMPISSEGCRIDWRSHPVAELCPGEKSCRKFVRCRFFAPKERSTWRKDSCISRHNSLGIQTYFGEGQFGCQKSIDGVVCHSSLLQKSFQRFRVAKK